jgi:hypothetical protein
MKKKVTGFVVWLTLTVALGAVLIFPHYTVPSSTESIFPIRMSFWYSVTVENGNVILLERHTFRWWKWEKCLVLPLDKAKKKGDTP